MFVESIDEIWMEGDDATKTTQVPLSLMMGITLGYTSRDNLNTNTVICTPLLLVLVIALSARKSVSIHYSTLPSRISKFNKSN